MFQNEYLWVNFPGLDYYTYSRTSTHQQQTYGCVDNVTTKIRGNGKSYTKAARFISNCRHIHLSLTNHTLKFAFLCDFHYFLKHSLDCFKYSSVHHFHFRHGILRTPHAGIFAINITL